MEKMAYNFNSVVRVKLTNEGRQFCQQAGLNDTLLTEADTKWYYSTLAMLFSIFGEIYGYSNRSASIVKDYPPFTEIEFVDATWHDIIRKFSK